MGASSRVASPAWAVGEPRASGLLVASDDGPGPAGLGCEGLVVPGRALLGVGPHRWPRARMDDRVSHRLMTFADVALAP